MTTNTAKVMAEIFALQARMEAMKAAAHFGTLYSENSFLEIANAIEDLATRLGD